MRTSKINLVGVQVVEIKTPRNLLPSKIESNPMGRQGYLKVSVGSSVYRLPFRALPPGPGLALINLTSFNMRVQKGIHAVLKGLGCYLRVLKHLAAFVQSFSVL